MINKIEEDYQSYLSEAVQAKPPFGELGLAAEAILKMAEHALSSGKYFDATFQSILLQLHLPGDPSTVPVRRWLASEIYKVEDHYIPQLETFKPLPKDRFRVYVDEKIAELTRIKHPMSLHMFQGTPTPADINLFLKHHWVRSYDFYRLLAELAFRFEDVVDAAVFYRNLYGEAGGETPEQAHPKLLEKLMRHRKIPLIIDFQGLHPKEKAYLNNRWRSVRHHDTSWGLAMLYAVESVSVTNHGNIYKMLQRVNVPEEYCDFHRLHGTADEIDTQELWDLIERFVGNESFQRAFVRSLVRHFEINKQYFDMLWEEMQGGENVGNS